MTRSKILALIISLVFIAGCASAGIKKPTVWADKPNNIPADTPSQFLSRYERFVTDKEQNEFKKLKTDQERQFFIDNFWAERDSDPATPENEEKERIDQLIDNIANEPFFSASGTTGLLFRSNGGFRGDMAQVYLLHGEPDVMDTLEGDGHSFVPLMLWIYGDAQNGQIMYAFLFYQKGNGGPFKLFPQDSYQLDHCGAIYEVATIRLYTYTGGGAQNCSEDLYQIYDDIYRTNGKGGNLDGYIFAWSLFNFSSDPGSKFGEALEPPKSALETAKQSNARVTGEAPELTGKAGADYILASCESCNSFIPAELYLGKEFFALSIHQGNIDWRIVGDNAEIELKAAVVIKSVGSQASPLIFEKKVVFTEKKHIIVLDPAGQIFITLLTADDMAQIPAGDYRVSVYVKNTMTGKYNTWSENFIK